MQIKKIFIGGWFQRTTLHLTEVWDLFRYGKSHLDFPKEVLNEARLRLDIDSVSRESGPLEYILVKTKNGIGFRIYEDGLIVLEKDFSSILQKDLESIKDYYDNKLAKAITLIFSKGAPVPKELANIKTILPYILTVNNAGKEEIEKLYKDLTEEIYAVVMSQNTEVYRGVGLIVINNLHDETLTREIIESQIFFREYKTQLHRYLNIHRVLWEKIEKIKERREIKGTQIDILRNELASYQKTINLIDSRIKQMGTYIRTRQKITDLQKIDAHLAPLFQLKFETLQDTHEYIKYLWEMTKNYLASTIETFGELQAKSTKNTISSLQLITTIGVVAGILGYLGKDKLPEFTPTGLIYFVLLLVLTWVINGIVAAIYKSKKYSIKSSEIVKNI